MNAKQNKKSDIKHFTKAELEELVEMLDKWQENPKGALQAAEDLLTIYPGNKLGLEYKAKVKSAVPGTRQEAIDIYTQLIELNPKELRYLFLRGECYDQDDDTDLALEDYSALNELEGGEKVVQAIFGDYVNDKKYDAALRLYNELKIDFIGIADEVRDLADYLYSRGDLQAAVEIYDQLRFNYGDANFDNFDIQQILDEWKDELHQKNIDKYRNVTFDDPIELERHFKTIVDKSRLYYKTQSTELLNIAKIIYYKRILDVTFELGNNSPFESIKFPYQLDWRTKYSGKRPHPAINYSQLKYGSTRQRVEDFLIAIIYEVTDYSHEEVLNLIDALRYDFKLSNISGPVFGQAFSLFIHSWVKSGPRRISIFSPSPKLGQLIGKVLKIDNQESIYDPAAGTASLLLNSSEHHLDTTFYPRIVGGNEPNEEQYLLAQMNLILNGYDAEKLTQYSPFQELGEREFKYDIAICQPVFGKKINRIEHGFSNDLGFPVSAREFAFLEVMLSKLKTEGRFAIVLPAGALFSGGKVQAFREELLKRDYVDFVLGLPEDIHHFTKVKTAIIFGRKREVPRSERDIRISLGELQSVDHIDELKITSPNVISGFPNGGPTGTTLEGIANYNYNLDPSRWNNEITLNATTTIESSDMARRLSGDIIDSSQGGIGYSGSDNLTEGAYPLVRITELANDPLNNTLTVKSNSFLIGDVERTIKRGILEPRDKHIISRDCLLIATKGNLLKPTIFKYSGSPIVIANGVFALFVNEDLLSLEYLANEFTTGWVEEQVKLLRTGAFIPYLRQSDILRILVEVPSLEEQNARVRRFKDFYLKKKLGSDEASKQLLEKKSQDFSKTLELMQHQLKHHIASVKSNSFQLRNFLQQRYPNILKESTLLNAPSNQVDISKYTLDKVVTKLELAASNMADELDVINQIKQLENEDPVFASISIYELLLTIKTEHETEMVKIHLNRNKQRLVADEKMLRSMFNMIIDNAIRHGIIESRTLNIWFETNPSVVHEGAKYFQIISHNDGKSLHPDFNLELFARYRGSLGEHQNKGIGGNHIISILAKHKGFIRRFKNLPSGLVEMDILIPISEV